MPSIAIYVWKHSKSLYLCRAKLADETFVLWAYTPRKAQMKVKKVRSKTSSRSLGGVSRSRISSPHLDELAIAARQAYEPVAAKRVRLVGLFERAVLNFTKRDLHFIIDASPSQEVFEQKSKLFSR